MTRELEKALQEIERLRQENAQLRKKLGIEVSEPKADYSQTGTTLVGSNTRVGEIQEARSYGGHGLSTSSKLPRVDSNFSAREKIKVISRAFPGERGRLCSILA